MSSIGDRMRVVLQWQMPNAVVAQMVTHYLHASGPDAAEGDILTVILTKLALAWAEIEDVIDTQVIGDLAKLSLWDSALDQFDEKATAGMVGFDGAISGDMLPHGVAPVIRFFTGLGRHQGRKFVPGLGEAFQDNGTIDTPTVAAFLAYAVLWDDLVTTGGSNFLPGVFNTTIDQFVSFNGIAGVNHTLGYQRRRKAGVGI